MTNFFEEQLQFLAAITRMLNAAPSIDGLHLHVELQDDDGKTVGAWSDEFGITGWAYTQVAS